MCKEKVIRLMQERVDACNDAAKDEALKAIRKEPEDEAGKALALRWVVKRDEMLTAMEIVKGNL